jgi:EAL domain-containing protein (putative c-di-GMP-specific phosphodiesterase class I)
MHNAQRAVALLGELKQMGIRIAIDDFGTGYSSLAYLKRFPINTVKIDRSFVADVPRDPTNTAITQAIIAMTHSLGLKVTAEGVETAEQVSFLREQGCEEMQGYYFSRPLPLAEATAILKRSAKVGVGTNIIRWPPAAA